MKHNFVPKISILAVPIMAACFGLASSSAAIAQSADAQSAQFQSMHGGCSDRTLFGAYGAAVEGVLLPVPSVVLQFRAITLNHFDGRGHLTSVEHTVINGAQAGADWTPGSGTYSVNPDCTGTATLNTPNSPVPLDLYFVVVKDGREIHAVLNSNAISTVFTKVE